MNFREVFVLIVVAITMYTFVEAGPVGRIKKVSKQTVKPNWLSKTAFNYKTHQLQARIDALKKQVKDLKKTSKIGSKKAHEKQLKQLGKKDDGYERSKNELNGKLKEQQHKLKKENIERKMFENAETLPL